MIFLLTFIFLIISTINAIPASGVYFGFRNDFIAQVGANLSKDLAALVNTDTTEPPINGNSGKSSYTFSNFRFNTALNGFSVQSLSPESLRLFWSQFSFSVTCDFHVCYKIFATSLKVCERGSIVTSVSNRQLDIGVNVDFSGPFLKVSAIDSHLQNPTPDVDVHCSSTVCVVPKHYITDPIKDQFYGQFQKSIASNINYLASQKFDTIPTVVSLPWGAVKVNMESSYYIVNNNLIVASKGSVGSPPFSPTFVPPVSAFSTLPGPVNVFVTSYTVDATFWQLNKLNEFNQKIDLKQTTNDFYVKIIFPGMKSYPNMNISITTSLLKNVVSKIDNSGIWFDVSVGVSVVIHNSTLSQVACVIQWDNMPLVSYSIASKPTNILSYNMSLSKSNSTLQVVKSSIGTVNTAVMKVEIDGFINQQIQAGSIALGYNNLFQISQLQHTPNVGYDLFSLNLKGLATKGF